MSQTRLIGLATYIRPFKFCDWSRLDAVVGFVDPDLIGQRLHTYYPISLKRKIKKTKKLVLIIVIIVRVTGKKTWKSSTICIQEYRGHVA